VKKFKLKQSEYKELKHSSLLGLSPIVRGDFEEKTSQRKRTPSLSSWVPWLGAGMFRKKSGMLTHAVSFHRSELETEVSGRF
jgi:hypothetical protein